MMEAIRDETNIKMHRLKNNDETEKVSTSAPRLDTITSEKERRRRKSMKRRRKRDEDHRF